MSTNTHQAHTVGSAFLTLLRTGHMVWTWLALLFLVIGWLCLMPIYTPPHASAVVFFVLAFALLTIAFQHIEVAPLPRTYLGLLFPLGFSITLIPWPYSLGSVLLVTSLIVMAAGKRSVWLRRGAVAVGASGLVLLIESAAQPALFRFFALHHGNHCAAAIVGLVLRSVGAGVSVTGSVLWLQTSETLTPINVTWEALGSYTVACLAIAGMALLLMLRVRRMCWLRFLAMLVIYPLVRYPILLLAYEEGGKPEFFWSPLVAVLTFIPLAVIIGRLVTQHQRLPEHVSWPQLRFGNMAVRASLTSCIAVMSIIGLFSFQDPGTTKHGRILIDEAHSNWEWTTRKYDTKWYNEASGYNYYCLADFLGYFFKVDAGNERITPDLLNRYDILILKTVTKPFEQEEIDAIVDFVHSGGGLWLVGDHTNVFGISAHMNPLARRFGMSYKYDATYDLATGGLSTYRRPTMLPHPTVQYMPPVFLFGTSCSMDAGLLVDYPVIGYGLRSLRADYSRRSFFPEKKASLDQEFGLLPQMIATRFGRGRVAAWTDSTVFSNFWFYMPGKSELCLGTMNWLNHRNRWGFVRWLFGIAAVYVLFLGVRWLRSANPVQVVIWGLSGALVGVPLGTLAFSALNRVAYPLPAPRRELPWIAFEREHCNLRLPSETLDASQTGDNNYHTFFVWTQRLGYMPASIPSLDTSLAKSKLLVLVDPDKDFMPRELLRIKRYVQSGGRVLVLDGANNQSSTANQLLDGYGIKIEEARFRQSWVFDRKGRKIAAVKVPRPVTGGVPVLRMAFGKPFLTATKVGKGLIAVMGSSHLYTNRSMGNTSAVPSANQARIYETEFWLFRNLMEGPSDPELWSLPKPR